MKIHMQTSRNNIIQYTSTKGNTDQWEKTPGVCHLALAPWANTTVYNVPRVTSSFQPNIYLCSVFFSDVSSLLYLANFACKHKKFD